MGTSCSRAASQAGKDKPEPLLIMHDSPCREHWDFVFFIAITAILIEVPFRIGFDIHAWESWLAVDVVTELLLIANIVINCLTSFEVDGDVVKARSEIVKRYVKSFFFVTDIISAFPVEILLGPILMEYTPLYTVNRLFLFARFLEFFVTWEKFSRWKPSVVRIAKSTFVVMYLAHVVGCALHLVIVVEGHAAERGFTGTDHFLDRNMGSRYLRSFYWSFVTMTGYSNTHPHTETEVVFCIIVTIVGISLFATIIGTVGSLVTNLDSSKLFFRQKMDSVNDYMAYKHIPDELQNEVRSYYRYLWKSGKGLDNNKVMDELPAYLRNKMSLCLNRQIIQRVPLFQDCKDDDDFISEVVKYLKPRVCLPNSYVVRKGETGMEMYFVSRGELNVVGDDQHVIFSLADGGFFGEIALLYDTKRTASIVARTYCDMYILTKDDFTKVMKKFPAQSKTIREIARERFDKIVEDERRREAKTAESHRASATTMRPSSASPRTGGPDGTTVTVQESSDNTDHNISGATSGFYAAEDTPASPCNNASDGHTNSNSIINK